MDEPLSNLDAKLRVTMRSEIIKLHANLNATTIYVTHDQIEAMTMASRIVVMKDGYIQQVGAPKDIYDNPAKVFGAGFIGTPPMNFINGRVNAEGVFKAEVADMIGEEEVYQELLIPEKQLNVLKENNLINELVVLGIRPEHINDDKQSIKKMTGSVLDLTVDVAELLGASTNIYATVGGALVCAVVPPRNDLRMGENVKLAFDMTKCHFFDIETEK